jgi:uncharacterized protein (TIGR03086 family)
MTEISDRYERLAKGFEETLSSVPPGDPRWQQQSPCSDWTAIDVVRHVVDSHRTFFGMVDHDVPEPPDDPLDAFPATRDAMLAALQDPAVAEREYTGQLGTAVWQDSVDRFIGGDLLVHRWDLARALGVDDELPEAEVTRVHEALAPLGDKMRAPGAFGPEIEAPADASAQDRMLAFLGRDPGWTAS